MLSKKDARIKKIMNRDPVFKKLVEKTGPVEEYTRKGDCDFLADHIVQQLLSTKAADKIASRLRALCGGQISEDALLALEEEDIRRCGVSRRKAEYLKAMAAAIKDGALDLEGLDKLSDEEAMKALSAIRGIGSWTAKMYMIFALGREDVLPVEDMAFRSAFNKIYPLKPGRDERKEMERIASLWAPYRSLAARYIYAAYDRGILENF